MYNGMQSAASRISASVVCAYVSRHRVPAETLPTLLAAVHSTVRALIDREPPARVPPSARLPNVLPDAIVSLEDGRPYRSLRPHLAARGLTPEAYREKWGLPFDYPMTVDFR